MEPTCGHQLNPSAGLNTSDAFSFNMGLWGFACFGTIGSWFIIPVSVLP
jgi:hypothetical protein